MKTYNLNSDKVHIYDSQTTLQTYGGGINKAAGGVYTLNKGY